MKKILGLDLGTASIGWALVNEAENENEKSSIVKLGVRVNPLTIDEQQNFEKGKAITTNANRTLKRSMRRNLQRYKLRRENLIDIFKKHGFVTDETVLSEDGNRTTFETYRLRAKAATEEIMLGQFARVLLMINKKRGYKSSRKIESTEDGVLIDGKDVTLMLHDKDLTVGQYSLQIIQSGEKDKNQYYPSDSQKEFDRIWSKQREFYPEILTDALKKELHGKKRDTFYKICLKNFVWNEKYTEWSNEEARNIEIEKEHTIVGEKRKTKGEDQKKENLEWRVKGLTEKLDLEQLLIVLQEINTKINDSSGYLGMISDRSKELYFNKQTVGQYQMAVLNKNPNASLRNMVFYRQDYLDEFNTIWNKQAEYHKELTVELGTKIRDIIFYQRPLKSQKGLISFCKFESRQIEMEIEGKKKTKTVGSRVIPRSSPLFQEFKIWQILNNLEITISGKKANAKKADLFVGVEKINGRRFLDDDEKKLVSDELSIKDKLTKAEILKLLYENPQAMDLNFPSVPGNLTQEKLIQLYIKIIKCATGEIIDMKKPAADILKSIDNTFKILNYNTNILYFNSEDELDKSPMYKLWHLLYSFEGDNSNTGNEKLIQKISDLYGFEKEYAKILANVTFENDYGNLSAKAIRKILPHLKKGEQYDVAVESAGYGKHSKSSLTKEEIKDKVLKDKLEILPKNSLRNPVVEKIINQMINVVNIIIDTYGKPDEIRIELARELKKNAKERSELTKSIAYATRKHKEYQRTLSRPPFNRSFNRSYISHTDIIRYKLYEELKDNGYRTLYSNRYISSAKLFSGDFDIEHIIPQTRLFDDSFSNKTLELRSINIEKGNKTAYDFVKEKYGETGNDNSLDNYLTRVENLFKKDVLSRRKYNKLRMQEKEIPDDFINRDLANTQYITKKAKEILEDLVKSVMPTTGSITERLREDWQLVDVMRELNWKKYDDLGLTEIIEKEDCEGNKIKIKKIKDRTKRNDHRHHAMDALTAAFTKCQFIHYLNNLNARRTSEKQGISNTEKEERDNFAMSSEDIRFSTRDVLGIEQKELYRDEKGKLRFKMPLNEFRSEAKRHLENTLISIKSKNKVLTKNINITKKEDGKNKTVQQTPRGQLHNETIYGSQKNYEVKEETVNAKFNTEKIATVAKLAYKEALLNRLKEFDNDPKKAFSGKNSPAKNPIFIDEAKTMQLPPKVKTVTFETVYTIRKEISPDLKLDKVVDLGIRKILLNRLKEFDNDPKKAFSNLDENPIWLNEEKGISIKRVTITGVSNAESLHDKRDKDGKLILDENGKRNLSIL